MTSTYSTNLRFELIGTGDQAGTWGTTTNGTIGTLLEEALCGYVTQAVTDGANTVLTFSDGATSVVRNHTISFTGALTADRTVEIPAKELRYILCNNTTGGFNVTAKVSGQTGVVIPNGKRRFVYVDATDVRDAINDLATGTSIAGSTILTATSGSTVQFAAGTVSLPSITTTGDLDTGIYFSAANEVAVTAGGTQRLKASSTGITVTGATATTTLSVNGVSLAPTVYGASLAAAASAAAARTALGSGTRGDAIFTSASTVAFDAGAVATPGIYFGTDSNTGFYSTTDGSINFTSNGVLRATWGAIHTLNSAHASSPALYATQTGGGAGVIGDTTGGTGIGIYGQSDANYGVQGSTLSSSFAGVYASGANGVEAYLAYTGSFGVYCVGHLRADYNVSSTHLFTLINNVTDVAVRCNNDGLFLLPYSTTQTTASAANAFIHPSTGAVIRSTSSRKWKTDIQDMESSDADALLQLRPVSFKSKGSLDDPTKRHYGLIAEEVAEVDSSLVYFSDDGQAEGVQYDRIVPHLINVITRLEARIKALEA